MNAMTAEMAEQLAEQILAVTEEEILPFMSEGVAIGFAWGSICALLSYGIVKAISLLNINNYNS